jgi:small subunit ribosomal protein S9
MADEDTPTPETPETPATPQAPEGEQTPEAAAPSGDQATEAPAQEPSETEQAPAGDAPAEESVAEQAPEPTAQEAAEAEAQAEPEPEPEPERDAERDEEDDGRRAAPAKPAVPGAHLEVDIVPEGEDPLGRGEVEEYVDPYAIEDEEEGTTAEAVEEAERADEVLSEPIATAAIDLAADARYRATGKRKTAIARVTLRPGSGTYLVNGRSLEEHFPRATLQRNIRQPLETVGYHERMDVVARLHGGGISAQAGALRHGVSRALLEADPNLRGELKRRGFLTRDSRAKERKKAGLKKARKRPQFSKR